MDRFEKNVIVFVVALVTLVVSIVVSDTLENKRKGECAMIRPAAVISGRVSNVNGWFTSGPVEYHVRFNGKTSKSDEVCEVVYGVTESQYDRWMNGG
jgi:hypothetical protein